MLSGDKVKEYSPLDFITIKSCLPVQTTSTPKLYHLQSHQTPSVQGRIGDQMEHVRLVINSVTDHPPSG